MLFETMTNLQEKSQGRDNFFFFPQRPHQHISLGTLISAFIINRLDDSGFSYQDCLTLCAC